MSARYFAQPFKKKTFTPYFEKTKLKLPAIGNIIDKLLINIINFPNHI